MVVSASHVMVVKTSLQQWFEYCTNGKKNCPVCKQTCTEKNTNRLFFQSVGDPNDPSLSQQPHDFEGGTPCELQNEVKRLEGKVLKLASTLEQQQKDLKEVNVEVNGSSFSCFGCPEFAVYKVWSCILVMLFTVLYF